VKDKHTRLDIFPPRLNPQTIHHVYLQSQRKIEVIAKVPRKIARPYIIGHVQIAVSMQEVIAQGTGYSLPMDYSRIFREPDRKVSLSSLWVVRQVLNDI
jgi:hypothetical protein